MRTTTRWLGARLQDFIANTLELLETCTKPSNYHSIFIILTSVNVRRWFSFAIEPNIVFCENRRIFNLCSVLMWFVCFCEALCCFDVKFLAIFHCLNSLWTIKYIFILHFFVDTEMIQLCGTLCCGVKKLLPAQVIPCLLMTSMHNEPGHR